MLTLFMARCKRCGRGPVSVCAHALGSVRVHGHSQLLCYAGLGIEPRGVARRGSAERGGSSGQVEGWWACYFHLNNATHQQRKAHKRQRCT